MALLLLLLRLPDQGAAVMCGSGGGSKMLRWARRRAARRQSWPPGLCEGGVTECVFAASVVDSVAATKLSNIENKLGGGRHHLIRPVKREHSSACACMHH